MRSTRLSGRSLGAIALGVLLLSPGCVSESSTRAAAQIGVLDLQRVIEETQAGKKVRETMDAFMKNRQALIELDEKDLKRMEEDLAKQASVLSAAAKKDREEQFRRRAIDYQRKVGELNREIQEKQQELLEGFRARVDKVTAKVSQRLGLLVVLQRGKNSFTIYSDGSLDVTQAVIDEFNKGTP